MTVLKRLRSTLGAVLSNLSSLLLALGLAIAIWFTAVIQEDPFVERAYPNLITISYSGLPDDLLITTPPTASAEITLRGPQSVLDTLVNRQLVIAADLSQLEPGSNTIPLVARVDHPDVRIIRTDPQVVEIQVERLVSREVPITLIVNGDPAIGYRASTGRLLRTTVTITGPESAVDAVAEVTATLTIANLRDTVTQDVALRALTAEGRPANGITLDPSTARATVSITQLGGYRDVAVRANVIGQAASGYRVTNIITAPSVVTLFSEDPQRVNSIPGFVLTEPLDITGVSDDIDARLTLELPDGVSLVGEQAIQVQVSIAALVSSLVIEPEVRVAGLSPGLTATIAPETLVIILSGPLPRLDTLTTEDITVIVDVLGLRPGVYELEPEIVVSTADVIIESVAPPTVEVIISIDENTPTSRPIP